MGSRQYVAFSLGILVSIISVLSWQLALPILDTKLNLPETQKNSAPPTALEACLSKQKNETCEFTMGELNITGVCSYSGKQLACGPSLLESQTMN